MKTIHKKIITDESMNPVAVQIDYADWLEIEKALEGQVSQEIVSRKRPKKDFRALAEAVKGCWKKGDGLEYQKKIRAEWDRDWERN